MGSPIKGKQIGANEVTDREAAVAAAIEITDSTNNAGSSTSLSRADHGHAHGTRGGGTLHPGATVSVAGFMSATDKTKLDAMLEPRFRDPKDSVRLLATADLAALTGNQTVDGVLTAPGERVALLSQTTTTEDGFYLTAAGAWARTTDMVAGDSAAGVYFPVEEGTANGDKTFLITNDEPGDIIGTDDLTFIKLTDGPAPEQRQEEVTTEAITSADTAMSDTLDFVPKSDASVVLFLNGVQQQQGAGEDYTISGQTITWLASSGTAVDQETTDTLIAKYVS